MSQPSTLSERRRLIAVRSMRRQYRRTIGATAGNTLNTNLTFGGERCGGIR